MIKKGHWRMCMSMTEKDHLDTLGLEIWVLQGRSGAAKEPAQDYEQWIVEGTKATGVRTATSLLTVGGYILLMAQQGVKAGMGRESRAQRPWHRSSCG